MSRARRVGTDTESKIVAYLREHGWPYAERRALRGIKDSGDIAGVPGVVIEAKGCARLELSEWAKEADREADQADKEWPQMAPHLRVVWHRRKGKGSPGEWFVTMTGSEFVRLLDDAPFQPAKKRTA